MSLEKLGRLTVKEFFARYPDDDTCLSHIMEVRYGLRHECRKCGVYATFHKLESRRAFSCAQCGDHVYPTAGTVFQDTRTPLQVWFYAIYLFVTTRHGVSGKELERTLGVTYKTAWRMGQQIRKLMGKADSVEMLKGHVEMDETQAREQDYRHGPERARRPNRDRDDPGRERRFSARRCRAHRRKGFGCLNGRMEGLHFTEGCRV
jgi:hypothetical protein